MQEPECKAVSLLPHQWATIIGSLRDKGGEEERQLAAVIREQVIPTLPEARPEGSEVTEPGSLKKVGG